MGEKQKKSLKKIVHNVFGDYFFSSFFHFSRAEWKINGWGTHLSLGATMIQDRKKEIFFGSILPAFPLIEGYIFAYEININVSIYKTEVLFWNAFLFLKKLQKVLPPILRREKKKEEKERRPPGSILEPIRLPIIVF